jgi:hypothetical protein
MIVVPAKARTQNLKKLGPRFRGGDSARGSYISESGRARAAAACLPFMAAMTCASSA